MLSHIVKGSTIGNLLFRRVCRAITCIPGMLIDYFIVAPWYTPYSSYWRKENKIIYLDGTEVGVAQGLFGYIGDFIGLFTGAIVGAVLGFGCHIPDGILRGLSWMHQQTTGFFDYLANTIGNSRHCEGFTFQHPANFYAKTWNIFAGTVGLALAAIPFTICKAIEFFIPPLGNAMSDFCWRLGGRLGGLIGFVAFVPLFLVNHTLSKLVNLYANFRNAVTAGCAFIYAKTNEAPYVKQNQQDPDNEVIHSQLFRDRVAEYKVGSTAQIFWGAQIEPAQVPIVPVAVVRAPAPVEVQQEGQMNFAPAPGGPAVGRPVF